MFAIGQNTSHINDVSESENKHLLKWFVKLVVENHDLQVRFRWQNPNDVGKLVCTSDHSTFIRVSTSDRLDCIDTLCLLTVGFV